MATTGGSATGTSGGDSLTTTTTSDRPRARSGRRSLSSAPSLWSHRPARTLLAAGLTTRLGDFVGIGALIPTAYARSGDSVIGPALLLATPALTALLLSTLGSGWLGRQEPKRGLVKVQILGAVGLSLPLLHDSLLALIAAALVFGLVRTAYASLQAAYVSSFPEELTGRYYGVAGSASATLELVGYVTGAGLALAIGLGPALMLDIATFVLAGALLTRLPAIARTVSRRHGHGITGWATIRRSRALRPYIVGLLGFAALSNLPETLVASAAGDNAALLPIGLALASAGTAVGAMIAGRTSDGSQPFVQLLAIGAGSLLAVFAPYGMVPGYFVIGLGLGWVAGAQGAVVRLVPGHNVAAVTAILTAGLLVTEGIGTLLVGALAISLGLTTTFLSATFAVVVIVTASTVLWQRSGPRQVLATETATAEAAPAPAVAA